MRTFIASAKRADSQWHVIDAGGKVLGRVATLTARLLQGKHKAIYTPFIDTGDHVVSSQVRKNRRRSIVGTVVSKAASAKSARSTYESADRFV